MSTSERDFVDENGGIPGFIRLRREVASYLEHYRELRLKRFFLRSQSALSLSRVLWLHAIFFSLDSSRQANVVSHGAERILVAF